MKRTMASCLVFQEFALTISARTVWPFYDGTSLPCAMMRILPSLISCKPNGGAALLSSFWFVFSAVWVLGGLSVAVGLSLAPSSRVNATTMLFDDEPLVE